jgi:hypothetical protein
VMENDVPDFLGLDSIEFVLRYDGDVLTFDSSAWTPEWTIVQIYDESHGSSGAIHVKLRRLKQGLIKAGQELARAQFHTALSRFDFSKLRLDSVTFNGDSLFAGCKINVLAQEDSARVHLISDCGDSLTRLFLNGKSFRPVQISPNPVNDKLKIRFIDGYADKYDFELFDVLGSSILNSHADVLRSNEFTINLAPVQEGVYYLRMLSKDGLSQTARIVIKR